MKQLIWLFLLIAITQLAVAQSLPKLIPYRTSGDQWGYSNTKQKMVVDPVYSSAQPFVDGLASVERIDSNGQKKVGFINQKGKVVVPIEYDRLNRLKEDRIAFKKSVCTEYRFNRCVNSKELWGFLDTDGKEVIAPTYQYAGIFSEGMARVKLNELNGFIDKEGKLVIPIIYDRVSDFSDGVAIVNFEGRKSAVINKKGELLTDPIYKRMSTFINGFSVVELNGRHGYINPQGEEVIPPQFDYALPFNNGLAPVRKKDKWGFIDRKGNLKIDYSFDEVMVNLYYYRSYPNQPLLLVQLDGKWGYVNQQGEWVIEPQYQRAYLFHEGLAAVTQEDWCGFIDETGEVVLQFQGITGSSNFMNGTATLFIDDKPVCVIDRNGNRYCDDW